MNSSVPHLLAALHAEGQALTQPPWLTDGFTCVRSNAIPFLCALSVTLKLICFCFFIDP